MTGKANQAMLFVVFVFWMTIIYDHWLFYLVMMNEIDVATKALASGSREEQEAAKNLWSKSEQEVLGRQGKDEDKCSCCRWNHRCCLEKSLCNCVRRNKMNYDQFKKGPFDDFVALIDSCCDPGHDQDLEQSSDKSGPPSDLAASND